MKDSIPYIAIQNHLSLARYAQIMRFDLPHLFQIGGTNYPRRRVCDECWTPGMRQQLREAISTAERMMAQYLRYPVAPSYIAERMRFPARIRLASSGAFGYRRQFGREGWPRLRTTWKKLLTLGRVEMEEQEFTMEWGCEEDGVDTLLTITIADATQAIDLSRLRVFHVTTMYFTQEEIRGLKIWRDGNNIRIAGHREMWLLPDACGYDECVDWADDDNFVSSVDQLEIYEEQDLREDGLCYYWTTDQCGVACTPTSQRGCPVIVDHEGGFIQGYPGSWDGVSLTIGTPTYCYPPDYVLLRYRAGWVDPLADGLSYIGNRHSVDTFGAAMAEAIVRLANTLLPKDVRCGCADVQQLWERDRMLVGYSASQASSSFSRPTLEESNRCPLGPTYGALHAWRWVKGIATMEAIVG